ncbi:TetR/AcrR family transcriptional regulator [Sunxiuqinia sp. sy24]|uniref:TetR/AcrR family transcriptional regulator n=1 Tax=Sunxiuqinia sp. sy24 TaxID=3461495 RepID=UPI004045B331
MIDNKKIIEKTYQLYLKYGIKSVSVDEIAAMLGISKKTLYLHIRSRNELIQEVVEYGKLKFVSGLRQAIASEEEVLPQLAQFFLYVIRIVRKTNPSFLPDLKKVSPIQYQAVDEFRNDQIYELIRPIIERGIEQGLFRPDLDIRFVYLNHISKMSERLSRTLPTYNQAIFSDSMYRLILNDLIGISTLKGHQQIENQYSDLLLLNQHEPFNINSGNN